jgi:FMN phosphatase YigB (HAD superfamily)
MFSFIKLSLVISCVHSCFAIILPTPASTARLALLTFDLDDTLFPVKNVVQDANLAMEKALVHAGFADASSSRITQHIKTVRKKQKKILTYSALRKIAIKAEIELLARGRSYDTALIDQVFNVWLQARHNSAETHLFPGAVNVLNQIKSNYSNLCIGAITNGKGNPLCMQNSLAPIFQFCVSGEDANVHPQRKPHRGIFKVALSEYDMRYPYPISDKEIWVHVGDCVANDVGGSAKMGAYTVLVQIDTLKSEVTTNLPFSTASLQESNNRKKLAKKSISMIDEKITDLSQLPHALNSILVKADKISEREFKKKAKRI